MPCLNDHEVSQFLLGTLPGDVADVSERHLLECDRCMFAADRAKASDPLVEALQSSGTDPAEDDAEDRSAISSLIERLGGLADEGHASACTQGELDQILAPPEHGDEIGRLAHYRILEVLGAGGMGIVFKAEDVELERIVALKVMRPALAAHPQAKRRFRREALAAAAFEHENIVTIYQVEEDRGVPFFSMQWLEGESLRTRLRRRENLPLAEALRITREVATGLAAAHARGLLHRDIKPDNIWLHAEPFAESPRESGRVKIVDFGLVRSLEEPSSLTHSGMILGTPQYMAPEQACGEEVDGRSDLFSVGCVLYQMLTGRPPFVAPNVVATLVAVSTAEVTPPHVVDPGIPRRVSDLTMRLLARERDRRIASAAELARETAQIERDLPKLLAAPPRPPRGKRLLFGALAAGLVAIVLGVIAVQTNRGTLVIEADDDVAVLVEGDAVELHDKSSGQRYELRVGENPVRPGEYEIVSRDPESGLEFSSREFAIRRGDRKSIHVALQPPGETVARNGTPPSPRDIVVAAPASDASDAAERPAWPPTDRLSEVETTLGIEPGEPLSPLTLVQNPRKLADTVSYAIEPAAHRGAVNDAAFSPDGTRIATAGRDGTVRIYDAEQLGADPQQIIVCPGTVSRVVWSPSGKYLATAVESPTDSICVWQTGQDVSLVGKIYRSTTQLTWSPDEELLAFSDGGIQFWSLGLGVLPSFGVTGEISHRPWSADGRTLATLSHEGEIQLWEIVDNRIATRGATLGRLYKNPPVFAEDGNYLAAIEVTPTSDSSGEAPRNVHVWDTVREQLVRNILLGRNYYASITWSPDDSRIAALGGHRRGEYVSLWNVKTGNRLPMSDPDPHLELASFQQSGNWSPDGNRLLVMHFGHALVWSAATDTWSSVAGTNTQSIAAMQGDYLAVRHHRYPSEEEGEVDQIDLWHVPELERPLTIAAPDVESFSLSPSGRFLAVIGPDIPEPQGRWPRNQQVSNRLTLQLHETTNGNLLWRQEFPAAATLGVNWSPDEQKLVLQTTAGDLLVVDATTSDVLHTLEMEEGDSRRRGRSRDVEEVPFAWSPDGMRIAWQGTARSIAITDLGTGEVERVLDPISPEARDAALARLTRLKEWSGRVRDSDRTGILRSWALPEVNVGTIAWSPDGRWAAMVGSNANREPLDLLVWDLSSPQAEPKHRIRIPLDRMRSESPPLVFSPNGGRLALQWNEALQCWDTESGQLILDEQIEGMTDFLGWLPDGESVALLLSPRPRWNSVEPKDVRLGVQTVGNDAALRQSTLHGTSGDVRLVGDVFHVSNPRSQTLQVIDSMLAIQSTYLFVADDAGDRQLVHMRPDGELEASNYTGRLKAIVLTDEGRQQTVPADNMPPTGEPEPPSDAPASTSDATSAALPDAPAWLGDLEDSLGVEPGEPLSPLALVRQPPEREGAISWTIETAEPRGAVHHAVFSPDGERVAAAGADGAVRIFRTDVEPPKLEQVFVCPGPIARLAWSHNGELIATALAEPAASICVWRLTDEHVELVSKINRAAGELAWSPDDRLLAFSNNGVQLWDLAMKTVLPNFGMTGEISSRPWSADGRYLASSTDGTIHVWDLREERLHTTIGDARYSPPVYATEGNFIAYVEVQSESDDNDSRPDDRYFQIWDVDKSQRVKHFPLERGTFEWSWSPDGTTIAILKGDELAMWDVRTGDETLRRTRLGDYWKVDTEYRRSVGNWSSDAARLVFTHYGSAYVWDSEANEWETLAGSSTELLVDRKGDVLAVRAYHRGELTPSGYYSSTLDVWNTRTMKRTLSIPRVDAELFQLSPDGGLLAAIGPQQSVREDPTNSLKLSIYDTATGEPVSESQHNAYASLGVIWSPDGSKLILRNVPSELLVVAAKSGDVVQTLTGPPVEFDRRTMLSRRYGANTPAGSRWQAAWSPDGTRVAWYGETDSITVSDVNTGEMVRALHRSPEPGGGPPPRRRGELGRSPREASAGGFPELLWSPDGRRIATRIAGVQRSIPKGDIFSTGNVLVWDLEGTANVPSVDLNLDRIWSSNPSGAELTFRPNGEQLVIRHDRHVLVYDAATGTAMARFEIEDLAEIVGWIDDTDHFVVRLEKPDRQWGLAVYDMHGDNTPLHEISIPEGSAIEFDGQALHVMRSNVIETFDPTLTLQSTSVFEHRTGHTRVVRVDSDGQVHGESSEVETVAVVLEQAGQRMVPGE